MVRESIAQAAIWFGWLLVLGVVAFPLATRPFPTLSSRGVALAPAFGLLLMGYLAWLGASLRLVPFGRASLLGAVGLTAIFSVISEVVSRGRAVRWAWAHRGGIVACIGTLAAAFAFFVWVRGFAPDIRYTEKPMEIGFLSSTMRARWMPPNDPWLAGYGINYYYFGYVLAGALGLLADLAPEVTFNLTGPTIFALTFTGASGIAFDLLARFRRERWLPVRGRTVIAAGAGGFLVALAGNAYGFARLLRAPVATVQRQYFWDGIGWNSSRVIYDEIVPGKSLQMITEFPYFSFILGDIHPHLLALPVVLLAVAVALGWWDRPAPQRGVPVVRLALTALVVGALYPTNAWDLPTYALLVVAALLLRRWPDPLRVARRWSLLRVGVVGGGAIALYAPYYANFTSLVGGRGGEPEWIVRLARLPVLGTIIKMLGVVVWRHTDLREFLTVFAVPLLAVSALLLRGLWGRREPLNRRVRQRLLIAGIAVLSVALLTRTPMLLPTGAVALAACVALTRPIIRSARTDVGGRWTPTDRLVTAAALYGTLLPVIPEFFYLRDAFDNRMNTMFKVDYQAWIILMLAGSYGVVTLVAVLRGQGAGDRGQGTAGDPLSALSPLSPAPCLLPPPIAAAIAVGLILFTLMAATYPVVVTYQKTGRLTGSVGTDFPGVGRGWQGLDGLRYVQQTNPDEYAAAQWLRANAGPDDRVLEAVGNSYGDANGWFDSRFAAATGVPDLLGWYFHEVQWRGGEPDVLSRELPARAAAIGTIYNTTNTAEARALLRQYDIRWVVVGAAERQGIGQCAVSAGCPPYAAAGLAKFTDLLEPAFTSGAVAIFRVP